MEGAAATATTSAAATADDPTLASGSYEADLDILEGEPFGLTASLAFLPAGPDTDQAVAVADDALSEAEASYGSSMWRHRTDRPTDEGVRWPAPSAAPCTARVR